MARPLVRLVLVLALAVGGAAASFAEQTALGADGVIYTARVGSYASLFPKGRAHAGETNVLALEMVKPDGQRTRLLAPGGEVVAPNAVPFVVWEDSSQRLFMVWEGLSHIHSTVRLVAFDGEAWSQPLQISGHPFTTKSSPQLAITRESYVRNDSGDAVGGVRTVLHLVWYEDDYGDVHVLYSPIVLDNGFTPDLLPPIFDLGLFVPKGGAAGGVPSSSVLRSPRVVAADDHKSVLVGLVDDATDQFATLRIDVLPVELSAVADELARFFAAEDNDPCGADITALAERARAHLVVIGTRFSAYARSYMADALREWLVASRRGECSNGGRAALAERARAHLVVIGRRALREVIIAQEDETSYLLTFDADARRRSDLSLSLLEAVTSPPALGSGSARVHIAGSGRHSIVSWLANRVLFYQEHDGSSWQPRQSMSLTDSFTLEQAYTVLDGRAR